MTINEINIGNKLQPTRKVWTHENNIAHGAYYNFDKKAHITGNIGQHEYNYINNKPLKVTFVPKLSFKGFSVSNVVKQAKREFCSTKPIYEKTFTNNAGNNDVSLSYCLDFVRQIDPVHIDEFAGYIKAFAKELIADPKISKFHEPMPPECRERFKQLANNDVLKENDNLRKLVEKAHKGDKNSKDAIDNIGELLVDLPRKTKLKRTFDTFTDLFVDPVKKLLKIEDKFEQFNDVNDNYSRFQSIIDSIKDIREDTKNPEEILNILRNDFSKTLVAEKANFKASTANFGNRLVSGTIAAFYLAIDQYNGTRLLNDNPNISEKERNTRFKQEMFRVLLAGYFTYGVMEVFKESCNKSMKFALGSSMAVVAFCEIVGRTLVGKPIHPVSKKKAKELREEDQKPKNGFAAKLGGLLSKSAAKPTEIKPVVVSNPENKQAAISFNNVPAQFPTVKSNQTSWQGNHTKVSSQVSFAGGAFNMSQFAKKVFTEENPKIIKEFDVQEVRNAIEILKNTYEKQAEFCESVINESLKDKKLKDLANDMKIPLGKIDDRKALIVRGLLTPVIWIKDLFLKVIPKLFKRAEELLQIVKKETPEKSSCPDKNIDTVKNILSFIIDHKNMPRNNGKIKSLSEKGLSEQEKKAILKIQEEIKQGFGKDVSKRLHYDQTTYSLYNLNLARIITSAFLITDAYNLAMQYSDGDQKLSGKRAVQRFFQEISRILFSAYIIKVTNNIFKRQVNKYLSGALGVTAINVMINENISRSIVGQPSTPKTKAQLDEIQKKNQASKSVIRRSIAKAIGKRNAIGSNDNNFANTGQTPVLTTIQPAQTNIKIPATANAAVFTQFIQKPGITKKTQVKN